MTTIEDQETTQGQDAPKREPMKEAEALVKEAQDLVRVQRCTYSSRQLDKVRDALETAAVWLHYVNREEAP